MPRKKKKKVEETEAEERVSALGSDAKRGIAAVLLWALALLFFLAFIGEAGSFGRALESGLGLAVGWSRWLLVPLFILVGGMLILGRRTSVSDTIKYVGLGFAFMALLGLAHLFLPGTSETLRALASRGEGGGFVGYFLSVSLVGAMGRPAAAIVLSAFFVSGMIAAFNMSLLSWYERLRGHTNELGREGVGGDGVGDMAASTAENEALPEEAMLPVDPDLALSAPLDGTEVGASLATEAVKFSLDESVRNLSIEGDADAVVATNSESESDKNVAGIMFDEKMPQESKSLTRRRSKLRWELPPLELLEETGEQVGIVDTEQAQQIIIQTLRYFGIEVTPGDPPQVGPTVTQYTFRPASGVKVSRITTLSNDLTLALSAPRIRIEAPVPGKPFIGIEVPNKSKATLRLRDFLKSREFRGRASNLTLVLGQDVSGKFVLADLGKMPHLLIAGTTRSGKSVCINTMLLSLLYQNSPEDLKLILVDPKRVELSPYNGIPHLRTDVIVENKRVVAVLRWAVSEMERRYKLLQAVGSRDLASYRAKVERGERRSVTDAETHEVHQEDLEPLPQLIIVIDEMADLMVAHGKEVEQLIVRLAQMARAVGLHLILATQRPEVNVITGLIKANMPARISFQLKSQIDSRTILDTGGAERLLGSGDMLYSAADSSHLQRIQGVLIEEEEVKRVVEFLVQQKHDKGLDEIGDDFGAGEQANTLDLDGPGDASEEEVLFQRAKEVIVRSQRASTTYLQTMLGIGYPKAARLTALLEERGVIGPEVNKRREVLMKELEGGAQYGDDPLADQAARDKFNF